MDLSKLPAPLERPLHTFSGQTVEVLRDLVLNGQIKAGERLNEVELSAALGISRGPLREAIQHLRSEGLLVTVSHRGAYVRTFSEVELSELYEVRIALESHAVRLAAEQADREAIEELRQLLSETDHAIDEANTYPRDIDFHKQVVLLADNQALSDAVVEVHRKIHLARSLSGHQEMRARRALSDHREIVDHLANREGDLAAKVLGAHLRSSLQNALALVNDGAAAEPASRRRGARTKSSRATDA